MRPSPGHEKRNEKEIQQPDLDHFVVEDIVLLFTGLAEAPYRAEDEHRYRQRDQNRREVVAHVRQVNQDLVHLIKPLHLRLLHSTKKAVEVARVSSGIDPQRPRTAI